MQSLTLIEIAGWVFPGASHFLLGRKARGLILGGAIWLMFIIGIFSGGAYYPGFDFRDGSLLYLLNFFAKLGNGLGAVISFFVSVEPSPTAAARATFEYGGRMVEIGGLLNYLVMLDAADIFLGRKK
ncbi:MAG: hypothetical protein C4324_07055 [Blastocatellia bacterium]